MGLAHLKKYKNYLEIYILKKQITVVGLAHLRKYKNYLQIYILIKQITLVGLAPILVLVVVQAMQELSAEFVILEMVHDEWE